MIPRGPWSKSLGVGCPRVVKETPDTIYLVLPSASRVGEGGSLSDEQLDAVAGGIDVPTLDALTCSGALC
jgi:hypothetical protein